jgi:hypothetical protein
MPVRRLRSINDKTTNEKITYYPFRATLSNRAPDIDPGMGTLTKYNENHNNITRFGSDYLPYVSDTDTRPDSLTGIAYPAGDTLLRNVSHGNPNAELIKKWL